MSIVAFSSQEITAASAERARQELLKRATPSHFVKQVLLAVGWWALFLFLGTTVYREYASTLGLFALPVVILYAASVLAATWYTFLFFWNWLAIITLKTPLPHRAKVHFFVVVLMLSTTTLIDSEPFSALEKTLRYLEHHGFFVLELVGVCALIAVFAYPLAKEDSFPRYPLRWYGLLTFLALPFAAWLVPTDDISSPYHYYSRIAYLVGAALAAYIGFFVGVCLGQRATVPTHET